MLWLSFPVLPGSAPDSVSTSGSSPISIGWRRSGLLLLKTVGDVLRTFFVHITSWKCFQALSEVEDCDRHCACFSPCVM